MKKILLIDGFGLIFRSYYAFISRPLTNKNGENVSAVFGFFKSVFAVLKQENPDYYLVALEGKGKGFRNELFPDYKAHRPPAPEDLKTQITKIIDIMDKLDMPTCSIDGYEADDVIGTLSEKFGADNKVVILSADKDLKQLIKDNVVMCKPDSKSQEVVYIDRDAVFEKDGVYPEQIVDYLAIMGDSADNIPGVKGIGKKGAATLLNEFGTLENIYENIENVKQKSTKSKLIAEKENAFLSKALTQIDLNIQNDIDYPYMEKKALNLDGAIETLESDGLTGIINDLKKQGSSLSEEAPLEIEKQLLDYASFIFVNSEDKLEELKKEVYKTRVFSFDLETTGFDYFNNKIISLSLTTGDKTFIVPFELSSWQVEEAGGIELNPWLIKDIFEDDSILKIGHNIKFDIEFMLGAGIKTKGKLFDTMLAEYALDSANNDLGLKVLGEKYFNFDMIKYTDIVEKKETLQDISIDTLIKYSGQDAFVTFELYKILKDKLEESENAKKLFYDIEMPLVNVLTDMEYYGVNLDRNYLSNLSIKLEELLNTSYQKMKNYSDDDFNPNSTQQLRTILFEKLELPVIKKTKTGPSTDIDVLNKLSKVHPFATELLDYRTYKKIKSTYSDTLPEIVNSKTGKIHTTYHQSGAQTGRLSSKDPNLQNIPIKSDLGREIRNAFIPSEGRILISADYSQVELYLLAELSKDPILYDAFKNGEDIHKKTASLIFDKDINDIDKDERRVAKTVNFGVIYGQGAYSLSEDLNISRKDASNFINLYFEKYHGVTLYMLDLRKSCEEKGYAQTYYGRKRSIPDINSKNKMIKANAERMAVNTAIQGTAADMIKIVMSKLFDKINDLKLNSKLIMQVHDELIFDVPIDEKDKMEEVIKDVMENSFDFSMKPTINIESGKSWGELH